MSLFFIWNNIWLSDTVTLLMTCYWMMSRKFPWSHLWPTVSWHIELYPSPKLTLHHCSCLSLSTLQAALLNSFPAIFDELLQMFTVQEVAEFVRGTLGSMPSTVHIGQSMDVVKLQSIARTVDSRLFSFPGRSLNIQFIVAFDVWQL